MTSPVIIDISHWQPDPNWDELKAGGIVGVIMKCTEGDDYVDPTFAPRYREALAAGMAVSTYHFLRPGDMKAQMNHYLNTLKPRDGERVCLDHEDKGVSLEDLEDAVAYLLTDSRHLQITVYSGNVIKEQLGSGYSEILATSTSLWLAQYSSSPSWPKGTWPQWTLWQYTDAGIVDGVDGAVDVNAFNGPPENAVKWIGPAGPPAPVPEPKPVDMILDLKVSDHVTYAVYVNGVLLAEKLADDT